MSTLMNVVILTAKCQDNKQMFGIRLEELSLGKWEANWTFILDETSAKREKYDQGAIKGRLMIGGGYPGCPNCKNKNVYMCTCGRFNCWSGRGILVSCAWCGKKNILSGRITSFKAGGDR